MEERREEGKGWRVKGRGRREIETVDNNQALSLVLSPCQSSECPTT